MSNTDRLYSVMADQFDALVDKMAHSQVGGYSKDLAPEDLAKITEQGSLTADLSKDIGVKYTFEDVALPTQATSDMDMLSAGFERVEAAKAALDEAVAVRSANPNDPINPRDFYAAYSKELSGLKATIEDMSDKYDVPIVGLDRLRANSNGGQELTELFGERLDGVQGQIAENRDVMKAAGEALKLTDPEKIGDEVGHPHVEGGVRVAGGDGLAAR